MNFDNFVQKLPKTILYRLVTDVQHIMSDHRGWLNQISQAAINNMPSLSPQIEHTLAHESCSFGRWFAQLTAENCHADMAIQDLNKLHTTLHNNGRMLNKDFKSRSDCAQLFESFLIDQFYFFDKLVSLHETAVKHTAIYHHTTGLIMSQHTDTLISQVLNNMRNLPEDDQQGCVAIATIPELGRYRRERGQDKANIVLETFTSRLNQTMRQSDSVIDYAEDTFLILLPGMKINDAPAILNRILDYVSPVTINDKMTIPFSLHIGVVNLDVNDNEHKCILIANEACQKAVSEGINISIAKFYR